MSSSSSASPLPPAPADYYGRRRSDGVGCSAYTLSLAAVSALCSVALVGIAFSTDNWTHIAVDRDAIRAHLGDDDSNATAALDTDHRYFDRVQGIFRLCFPHELKPPASADLYLNQVEEWCTSIDYHVNFFDAALLPERLTYQGEIWFHVARSSIFAFCLYFMLTGIGCVTGLRGCWASTGEHLVATAALFLLASLSAAGGMGLWHWAQFYQREKVMDERLDFFLSWPAHLRMATSFTLGWSYILAWLGVGLGFLASALFSCSAACIGQEVREAEHREVLINMHRSYPTLMAGQAVVARQPNGTFAPSSLPGTMTTTSRRGSVASFPEGDFYSMGSHYHQQLAPSGAAFLPPAPPGGAYPNASYHVENAENANRTLKYKSVVNELKDAKL